VVEAAGEGVDTVFSSITYTLSANVERLYLTGTAWKGTGNALDNWLVGNDRPNILDGLGGDDRMVGGLGDDWYYVDSAGDVVVEAAGEGLERVYATVDHTLSANVERLYLMGTAQRGAGNELDNWLIGNDVANVLDGGAGADRMVGGLGDDTYVLDHVGDQVEEAAGEGLDTVFSSISHTLSANVERLHLTGTATSGTGNALDNWLVGNNRGNILDGLGGDDRMVGGLGDDWYYVDSAGDEVVEASGQGLDRVYASVDHTLAANVERLYLTGTAQRGTGNRLDNWLTGTDGANILEGGAGSDRLFGLGGADTLTGGSGADLFVFSAITDSLVGAADRITDFEKSLDRVDLRGIDANLALAGDQAFSLVAAFSQQAGQAVLSYDVATATTTLSLDQNGDGVADFALLIAGQVTMADAGTWLL
jgi:Ca2+-binding RTX toxin-like protein